MRHEEVSFYLFLLPRPAATRPTATRQAATRPAAIRPAAKRSCLSHSRPTSLILHDTLHWPRASSFQLPWEGRGVSVVMLNSFGFIPLGKSSFASHRSSGLLCASSLHSCGDTHGGDALLVSRIRGRPASPPKVLLMDVSTLIQPTLSQHNLRPRRHVAASRPVLD